MQQSCKASLFNPQLFLLTQTGMLLQTLYTLVILLNESQIRVYMNSDLTIFSKLYHSKAYKLILEITSYQKVASMECMPYKKKNSMD